MFFKLYSGPESSHLFRPLAIVEAGFLGDA
jgi:hypothetical protein